MTHPETKPVAPPKKAKAIDAIMDEDGYVWLFDGEHHHRFESSESKETDLLAELFESVPEENLVMLGRNAGLNGWLCKIECGDWHEGETLAEALQNALNGRKG